MVGNVDSSSCRASRDQSVLRVRAGASDIDGKEDRSENKSELNALSKPGSKSYVVNGTFLVH